MSRAPRTWLVVAAIASTALLAAFIAGSLWPLQRGVSVALGTASVALLCFLHWRSPFARVWARGVAGTGALTALSLGGAGVWTEAVGLAMLVVAVCSFWMYGLRPVLAYFGLRCPKCRSFRTIARLHDRQCRQCAFRWHPRRETMDAAVFD